MSTDILPYLNLNNYIISSNHKNNLRISAFTVINYEKST